MKRTLFVLLLYPFISFFILSPAYAKSLKLLINEFGCVDEDKIRIKYSVINEQDFDRPNVMILFKILLDGKPAACEEVKVTVPKRADRSEEKEIIINVPCTGKSPSLKSGIFHNVKRYSIDKWLSDCPGKNSR